MFNVWNFQTDPDSIFMQTCQSKQVKPDNNWTSLKQQFTLSTEILNFQNSPYEILKLYNRKFP